MKHALFILVAVAAPAFAAPAPLHVFAAGSVTGALAAIAKQYTADSGQAVDIVGGPAGELRERIERGEDADVYISANMAHPERLAREGKAGTPVVVVRNGLCVTTRPDVGLTPANMIDVLLKPAVHIGTSTPGADPSGDYAFAFFDRVDQARPGDGKTLAAKARKLLGGPVAPAVPGHGNPVTYFLQQHTVDAFFGYCSSHDAAPDPALVKVPVPAALSLPVDYGMSVVLHPEAPERERAAYRFAQYLMSPGAQHRVAAFGFVPVADVSP